MMGMRGSRPRFSLWREIELVKDFERQHVTMGLRMHGSIGRKDCVCRLDRLDLGACVSNTEAFFSGVGQLEAGRPAREA